MKFNLSKIAVLFLTSLTLGQTTHLEPEPGIFSTYDTIHRYYAYTKYKLLEGVSSNPEVMLFMLPSFEPESVFLIESKGEDPKYFLSHLSCEEQIWYSEDSENIKIIKKEVEVSKHFTVLMNDLWNTALSRTKYPDKATKGLDGATYVFAAYMHGFEHGLGAGMRAGSAWSPEEGCLPYEIISLTREIIGSLQNENFDESNFESTIEEILKEFK